MHALPNGAVDTCGAGRKRPPGASKVPLNTRPDKHPLLHPCYGPSTPQSCIMDQNPATDFLPCVRSASFAALVSVPSCSRN